MSLSVEKVLDNLSTRDLLELARQVSGEHFVELDDMLDTDKHGVDVVRARHALWDRMRLKLGSYAAVARVFNCNHTSVSSAGRLAAGELAIVEVLLDCVEGPDLEGFALRYRGGRAEPFGITNGLTGKTCWFAKYDVAAELFRELCAVMGEETILGRSRRPRPPRLEMVQTPTPAVVLEEAAK